MSVDIQRKIGFSRIKNLSSGDAREILERVGGVDGFYNSSTRLLWERIGSQNSFCTDASRDALLELGRREEAFISENHINPIFITDDEYPSRLKECSDAPVMLYRLGECDLNAKHVVSIVGTRMATAYGIRFTNDLVKELAETVDDLVIVSGLAYGIDVASHKAALEYGVPTVGVVAHGLKMIYPADHRDIAARMVKNGGALLTEYTSDAPVHKGNFLARNRIVAGLSDVTVVVESQAKGGAMVTASIASAYNRDVFAAPGRTTDRYSAGPLKLIASNRAALIRSADDIVDMMNWERRDSVATNSTLAFPTTRELDKEEQQIVDYLRMNHGATANDMVAALSIPYATLSSLLMKLEMDDVITALPGSAFSVNI